MEIQKHDKVALVYAKTFLDLALEKGEAEKAYADMALIGEVLGSDARAKSLLASPALSKEKKAEWVKGLFEGRVQGLTLNLILLLAAKARLDRLEAVTREFRLLDEARRGIRRARILSARPLTPEQVERIRKKLEAGRPGSRYELETAVDEGLLAGFRVQEEDHILDASARHKLTELRKRLAA